MTTYIYSLQCPKGEVRYIGKTTDPQKRLRKHISGAKTRKENHHNAHWIRGLLADGHQPTMEVLYAVPENETWQEVEKYFIGIYRAMGFRLTNILEGGGAEFDVSPEAVAARAEKAKITRASAEYRAKMGKISSECWADPRIRAARLESMAKTRNKPGQYEKRVAQAKEVASRPEVKAKRSASQKASYASGNRINSLLLPCVTAKRQAGTKERWSKPEEKEKVRKALLDPERQASMQAAITPEIRAARQAKATATARTPEARKAAAESTKIRWQDPEYKARVMASRAKRFEDTHTPEHIAMMRDRKNEARRVKRAAKKAAILAATTATPYTESS